MTTHNQQPPFDMAKMVEDAVRRVMQSAPQAQQSFYPPNPNLVPVAAPQQPQVNLLDLIGKIAPLAQQFMAMRAGMPPTIVQPQQPPAPPAHNSNLVRVDPASLVPPELLEGVKALNGAVGRMETLLTEDARQRAAMMKLMADGFQAQTEMMRHLHGMMSAIPAGIGQAVQGMMPGIIKQVFDAPPAVGSPAAGPPGGSPSHVPLNGSHVVAEPQTAPDDPNVITGQ